MATKQTLFIVATITAITFCSGTSAKAQAAASEPEAVAFEQSAEAPPAPGCFSTLLNLSDRLTYVEAGSNLTKPDNACCRELAGLVESSPQCLCNLLDKNKTASHGLDIDMKRVLNLPTVCHVSTPPINLCSVINGSPVGGPTPGEGSGSPGLASEGLATSSPSNRASNIAVSGLAFLLVFLPTIFGI